MNDLLDKLNKSFCESIATQKYEEYLSKTSGELNPDLPTCSQCSNEDYWEDISYYNFLGDKVYVLKCEGCEEEIYL